MGLFFKKKNKKDTYLVVGANGVDSEPNTAKNAIEMAFVFNFALDKYRDKYPLKYYSISDAIFSRTNNHVTEYVFKKGNDYNPIKDSILKIEEITKKKIDELRKEEGTNFFEFVCTYGDNDNDCCFYAYFK